MKKTFPAILIVLSLSVLISTSMMAAENGNLIIKKSEITSVAKFIPYKADGVNMEIIAVKASDGSIRTAFNTCQICYNSGRGFYKQQGDVFVCQNCGNRFKIDQVEQIKGGCNPIPILKEDKQESASEIVIPAKVLASYKQYFLKWKR